jgi:hypothetical protein
MTQPLALGEPRLREWHRAESVKGSPPVATDGHYEGGAGWDTRLASHPTSLSGAHARSGDRRASGRCSDSPRQSCAEAHGLGGISASLSGTSTTNLFIRSSPPPQTSRSLLDRRVVGRELMPLPHEELVHRQVVLVLGLAFAADRHVERRQCKKLLRNGSEGRKAAAHSLARPAPHARRAAGTGASRRIDSGAGGASFGLLHARQLRRYVPVASP